MKKLKIPQRLREQLWVLHYGETFRNKCKTNWCSNTITVYDFHCGHKIAEARGGPLVMENLVPLCVKCNLSMSTTCFDEWCKLGAAVAGPETKAQKAPVAQTFKWCFW
jgi:5-methylcytosine-specific restriction endonuclease McrA